MEGVNLLKVQLYGCTELPQWNLFILQIYANIKIKLFSISLLYSVTRIVGTKINKLNLLGWRHKSATHSKNTTLGCLLMWIFSHIKRESNMPFVVYAKKALDKIEHLYLTL
jgi:hypothetical protein